MGLRARGGYEVSLFWKAGSLTQARIVAENARTCRVRSTHPLNVRSQGGMVKVTRPEPNVAEFQTTPGAAYVLSVAARQNN